MTTLDVEGKVISLSTDILVEDAFKTQKENTNMPSNLHLRDQFAYFVGLKALFQCITFSMYNISFG